MLIKIIFGLNFQTVIQKYQRRSLFSPKIIDGSSIVIGKKKEEEPFDRTEFAKEITAIIANLAQALAVVVIASNPS